MLARLAEIGIIVFAVSHGVVVVIWLTFLRPFLNERGYDTAPGFTHLQPFRHYRAASRMASEMTERPIQLRVLRVLFYIEIVSATIAVVGILTAW